MSRWLVFSCLLAASAASAQVKVFVLAPAINTATGPASAHNSNECLLEDIVANDVFNAVQSRIPEVVKVKNEADVGDGLLLRLIIVDVVGWGGGGWSGSKSMSIRGELVQGGQVVRASSWRQRSRGGVLGPVKGTCDIFEDISRGIARQVRTWVVVRTRPSQPDPQPPAEERKDGDGEKQ